MSGGTYTQPNSAQSHMYPSDQGHVTPVVHRARAMAIIFVPGVMGSNLFNTKLGTPAWMPPDGLGQKLKQVWSWWHTDAEQRQELFNASDCEVDREGQLSLHHRPLPMLSSIPSSRDIDALNRALNTLSCGLSIDEAIERGWGSAH